MTGILEMLRNGITDQARAIVWSMRKNPDDWQIDHLRCINETVGVGIWIASGSLFVSLQFDSSKSALFPAECKVGLFDRLTIWREVRALKERKIVSMISSAPGAN